VAKQFTLPVLGNPGWGSTTQTALSNLDGRLTSLAYDVREYGAYADGVSPDDTYIAAAVAAAATTGGMVLIPGKCAITAPIVLPPNVWLRGMQALRVFASTDTPFAAGLKLTAAFSGAAAILLVDKATGGYPTESSGQRITDLNIDGSSASGTVDGIQANGLVHDVQLDRVWIRGMPRHGIDTSGTHPYSWNMFRVTADSNRGSGFVLNKMTDSTLLDCQAIGNTGGDGFTITEFQNGHLVGCRSEWNSGAGFSVAGAWGTGSSAGGMTMTACSSDRNVSHGLSVTATGPGPLSIVNCHFRRDGSNGTGNAININGATMPVYINGAATMPGVNDDGLGTQSPITALSVTGATYVSVADSLMWGVSIPIADGGGNTVLAQSNVATAIGSTGSPTYHKATSTRTALLTLANSTTETVLHSLTIRANTMSAGATYTVEAWGTAGVTGTPTLTLRLRIGGVAGSVVGSVVLTAASGATGKTWRARGVMTAKGIGAGSNWHGFLEGFSDLPTAATPFCNASASNTSVDTVSDQSLVLTAQWSAASASNQLLCPAGYAYRVVSS
jgi:hypothetical protein